MTDSSCAVQYVLYCTDAVEVSYVDGSCLQMAPCGSAFIHYSVPAPAKHPLEASPGIHQRTQFATSAYRSLILDALEFRNRFAERPFWCREVVETSSIVSYIDATEDVTWPEVATVSDIDVLPDGSFRLRSTCGKAEVSLSSNQQLLTSRFLSRLNDDNTLDGRDGSNMGHWDHIWTTQHHSMLSYPAVWSVPVKLLREFIHSDGLLPRQGDCTTLDKDDKKEFPRSLPLQCVSQHLHRWSPRSHGEDQQRLDACSRGNLKVVCSQGTIYRLFFKNPKMLEIYLVDGSVIRSTGLSGQHYVHYFYNGSQIEERMYSALCPFPDTVWRGSGGQACSIEKLIQFATRLQSAMVDEFQLSAQNQQTICWKVL